MEEKLLKRAKEILRKNWRVKYTIPSWKLYPHQWSWDSAFISIGYSHYDQEKVNSDQRPSDEDYARYIYLVEIMKKNRYDEDAIYQEIPFKIKDIAFNSILYTANRALLNIADSIDETTEEI